MPEQINDTTFEVTLSGGDKVEIGDKESTDFKPHIKLNRWDGECFIAIKPANLVEEEVEYEVEGDKVKCKYKVKYEDDTEEEFEAEFYPLEPTTVIAKDKDGNDVEFGQNELGGFEFEIILKEKPLTNKIVLNIETQELKFYYQPELTQQEIDEGCIRPDNVVGSYAVYHATRGNFHRGKATAEKYKCSKAFHIYRPKIVDAVGKWVWGELSIDEQKGTLTNTIPQDFLDTATYPIRNVAGLLFGYDTPGGSSKYGADTPIGYTFTGAAGTAISMSYYEHYALNYPSELVKMALYLDSNYNFVAGTLETAEDVATDTWCTLNFSGGPEVSAIDYVLVWWTNTGNPEIGFDSGIYGEGYYKDGISYNGWPASIAFIDDVHKYSIYCTYEEEAAPTGQPYISRVQGVQGMRSYGGI